MQSLVFLWQSAGNTTIFAMYFDRSCKSTYIESVSGKCRAIWYIAHAMYMKPLKTF